jgi:hypothetical protein
MLGKFRLSVGKRQTHCWENVGSVLGKADSVLGKADSVLGKRRLSVRISRVGKWQDHC